MLETQKYLEAQLAGGMTQEEAYASLYTNKGIEAKLYPDMGVVLLDYGPRAVKTDTITIECRSLILDLFDFSVHSRSFDRFFNLGEDLEGQAKFTWDNFRAMEKADGSLIKIWYNHNTKLWYISTRGMADAGGRAKPHMPTFKERVLTTLGLENDDQLQEAFRGWEGYTVIFEYTGPTNRVVTRYEKEEMVLLDIIGDDGVPNHVWNFKPPIPLNFRRVNRFHFTSQEQVVEAVANLKDLQEGFVLVDQNNRRIKVKSSVYVTAHALKGNDSEPDLARCLELIFTGEDDEFLLHFGEWAHLFDEARFELNRFHAKVGRLYYLNSGIESQKDFALAIKDMPGKALMFTARKLGISPLEAFEQLETASKLRLFMGERDKVHAVYGKWVIDELNRISKDIAQQYPNGELARELAEAEVM